MRFRDEALREVSGGLGMFRGVRLRGIVSDGVWEYFLSEVELGWQVSIRTGGGVFGNYLGLRFGKVYILGNGSWALEY